MDPTQLFNQCRPYSSTSGKYYIHNDDELLSDPFGYYTGRMIGHREPNGFLYHPNFPM
jgi:hypothetical protein